MTNIVSQFLILSQRACKAGSSGEKPAMEACLQKQAIRQEQEGSISSM
jgi:hypothetical protein